MGSNAWQDLAESPTAGNDLPLWALSLQELMRPRTQTDNSTMVDLALLNRYPHQQPYEVMNSLSNEMLPNTQVPVRMVPHLKDEENNALYGSFDPASGEVSINKSRPMMDQLATLPHELAHAADAVQGFDSNAPTEAPNHHQYFENFEQQFAQSLDAQRAIEHGWPVNPDILVHYPWLKDVKSESSNKLASPWNFDHAFNQMDAERARAASRAIMP